MFWADKLLENQKGKQLINDSWTPSGIVHMGSLKGPVIHDTLLRILKEKGADVSFTYGFDDMDPIDGLPKDLEHMSKYLGIPIFQAPSPDGNGTFSDYFSKKMQKVIDELGIQAKIYRTSNYYLDGTFNNAIKKVLDDAQKVRDVYGKIYKKTISKDWYPLQVICPNCGKLGTTKVTGWDGKEVAFHCSPDLVKWAKGCDTKETMSPFDGKSKMLWKVEWAAKWATFGVTIEGAGKDHGSAGGSYDVAMMLARDVFEKEPPLKLTYEFFLSGGKKMSSSKGLGLTGKSLLEVIPPQLARFLMIKTPPNQAVEFTPRETDSIPRVFDAYQLAENGEEVEKRVFNLSQIDKKEKVPKLRFSVLAQWVQMPNMEEEIKKEGLEEWARYARVWVEKYAPESEKFFVQKILPEQARELSEKQKEYLVRVSSKLDQIQEAREFQKQLYDLAKEIGISSKEAFAAIYVSLIGKDHGPKAGWFILSLDKDFVKKRFKEI